MVEVEVVNTSKGNVNATHHALTALILGIIPGGGQFYNRQWVKGLIFFIFLVSFFSCSKDLVSHGLWGLVTLGEQVPRDNSIFLLAEGIITVLMVILALALWGVSLHDA